ncbi:MAG: hypothetical protein Q9167_003285 [Letrouitia subvulpina]
MALQRTNYPEIQQDEIDALRSIYMDDFEEEESKVGAWNSLRSKSRMEAEEILRTKSRALLGSEMIFEISTCLQDILEQAAQTKSDSVLTLEQERDRQQAAASQREQQAEEAKHQEKLQASTEEERKLAQIVSYQKVRMEKHEGRSKAVNDRQEGSLRELTGVLGSYVHFDRPTTVKDLSGHSIVIHAVNGRVGFRQGPVTKVSKVHYEGAPQESPQFLALKECHLSVLNDENDLKRKIQALELKLDQLTHLALHANITMPLNFSIQRSLAMHGSNVPGWDVKVLMEFVEKGSMQGLLETIGSSNPSNGRAWTIQLTEALDHYHKHRMVHGNVHLNNILLEKATTGNVVIKLADGGYMCDLHALKSQSDGTYSTAVSTYWTTPEIFNDSNCVATAPMDIWNLGVVIMQMFFGLEIQSLHQSPNAFFEATNLSSSLEHLLRSIFKDDPKKRPSAWELTSYSFLRSDDPFFDEFPPGNFPSNRLQQRHGSIHMRPSVSRFVSDFVQEGRLGRGGYGEVVKARNKLDSGIYAIKKIKQTSEATLDKVLGEVRLLQQLNHPNVVKYFTAWKENDTLQSSRRDSSSLDEQSSSSNDEELSDLLFAKSSGGLDFIGSGDGGLQSDESDDEYFDRNEEDGIVFGNDDSSDDETATQVISPDIFPKKAATGRTNSVSQELAMNTTLYIQMEYCEKQTLRDLIKEGLHDKTEEGWRLLRQILQGLAHIHAASIVHRDLKPENIFIDINNNIRIGDFGLARPGDSQPTIKATDSRGPSTSFTKSIGTTFYVAPEVRSTSNTKYDEKADMYSLGVIFFEMSFQLKTGMERVHALSTLRKQANSLPSPFEKDPDKVKHGQIVLSLVSHSPRSRPSSIELLSSGHVPVHNEDELMRTARRYFLNPESAFRSQLFNMILSDEVTKHPNANRSSNAALKDYMYDLDDWHVPTSEESLLQNVAKNRLISIFRSHGAVEAARPSLIPYSSYYSNYLSQACKFIDPNGSVLQLPFDLTLPYARVLSKHTSCAPKTFTFGEVYRKVPSGGHPRIAGEVDFDIMSYNNLDLALQEAEVIKVLDEIIDAFPSMSSVQMCYQINHARILEAILDTCDIAKSKQPAVKECISRLNTANAPWSKIRSELRAPPLSVSATSLEELIRFDFRDTCENAIARLRSMLQEKADLESTFAHIQAVIVYLGRLSIKRKVYICPLSGYNEKFYRDNILFQCIYDSKKRNVFAAGGRYDQLIKDHQLFHDPQALTTMGHRPQTHRIASCHAVGFNLSWRDLHKSMIRHHKLASKEKLKDKRGRDSESSWHPFRRCEVLVDSFDKDLLRTSGLDVIQLLWLHNVQAELALDHGFNQRNESAALYNHDQSLMDYNYILIVKQEGFLKIRNIAQNEEIELRTSELPNWLKSEFANYDRNNEYGGGRLHRQTSLSDQPSFSLDHAGHIQVLMSQNKGKKVNRRTIVEEALARSQDFMNGIRNGNVQIAVMETKEDIFEGIRDTRLSDADSWKKFIQSAPPTERQYLGQVHGLLKEYAVTAKAPFRSALLYNFRTGGCIWYDLGRAV